ncbi:hypothetical protein L6452_02871 [Arctium lappa]|uniref:Uncharacterized protein n=1 Tax=Arctium lappa TaxID=4217 RepID=A0ACB9FKA3_ARCLA|nr:hypothetical protein L6452_02871 [Arctium lappa]
MEVDHHPRRLKSDDEIEELAAMYPRKNTDELRQQTMEGDKYQLQDKNNNDVAEADNGVRVEGIVNGRLPENHGQSIAIGDVNPIKVNRMVGRRRIKSGTGNRRETMLMVRKLDNIGKFFLYTMLMVVMMVMIDASLQSFTPTNNKHTILSLSLSL